MQMWPSSHMVRSRGRRIRVDWRFSSWSSAKFDSREARHTACEKDLPSRERRADTKKIVRLYSMFAAARQERLFWLELLARKFIAAPCRIARRDGAVAGSSSLRRSAHCAFSYSSSDARAQCTAQDVLQNQLKLPRVIPSASVPQILVKSAADVPVWKTITVGTFTDTFALRNALDAAGCSIGDLAGQILARPAFTLSVTKTSVELFAVSAAELGFETDTAVVGGHLWTRSTGGFSTCGSRGRSAAEAPIF